MKLTAILCSAVIVSGALMLPACQSSAMSKVPMNAAPVASGIGSLTYRTSSDGTLYIVDKSWDKVVYSGPVKAGQTVAIDAPNDQITIDGRAAASYPLGEGSEYRIFVDQGGMAATNNRTTKTTESTTVTETHQQRLGSD